MTGDVANDPIVRALAMQVPLTVTVAHYAFKVADRYARRPLEYADTGDVVELHQEEEGEPEPGLSDGFHFHNYWRSAVTVLLQPAGNEFTERHLSNHDARVTNPD